MRVIFTCGGTAGHINPALALAKSLQERKPGTELLFVGAAGESMEAALVPRAGYRMEQVDVSSFWRQLNWKSLKHNLRTARNILVSRRQSKNILEEFKPDLVVGTGGFASYPVTREAARQGIPTAIHESNAVPGLTTRRLAPHVNCVMVGLPDPNAGYPPGVRVEVTGTPVRPDFFTKTRREARAQLGLRDDKPLVLACWGSLGADAMNILMTDFVSLCARREPGFHLIYGTGKRYYGDITGWLAERGVDLSAHPELSIRDYIYDMPLVMAAADLVLCRAGASTISELIALGKPAILVPSPNVTGDHQTKNARVLADSGAGVLLPEKDCDPQRLLREVTELLNDQARREKMGRALAALAPPDVNQRILELLLELARAG